MENWPTPSTREERGVACGGELPGQLVQAGGRRRCAGSGQRPGAFPAAWCAGRGPPGEATRHRDLAPQEPPKGGQPLLLPAPGDYGSVAEGEFPGWAAAPAPPGERRPAPAESAGLPAHRRRPPGPGDPPAGSGRTKYGFWAAGWPRRGPPPTRPSAAPPGNCNSGRPFRADKSSFHGSLLGIRNRKSGR